MLARFHLVCLAAACGLVTGTARAQFAPPSAGTPTPSPAIGDPGNSVAAPSSGGALNIGAPTATPSDNTALPPAASPTSGGPLRPLRANVSLTTNAMIGFVNATPIFLDDIFRPIDADLRRLADRSRNLAEFRDGATTLISNQIRQQISENLEVTSQEAHLTDDDRTRIGIYLAIERSKLIAKYGGSIPAADRALAATGSSVEKEMADLRRGAIKNLYFTKNLLPRIVVTRQMELDAYDQDPKRWQQTATVELYTITLNITRWLHAPSENGQIGPIIAKPTEDQLRNAERSALAEAYQIEAKLRAGADFAKLVEDSDSNDGARGNGGRTPQVTRGSMANSKFEDYVFSLPANTLGDPQLLRQPDFRDSSVVIVRVGKKVDARTVPFAEAQTQIALDLKQAQLRELQIQDMDKLSKGAAIEAVDHMLSVAVDAAVTRYATGTGR